MAPNAATFLPLLVLLTTVSASSMHNLRAPLYLYAGTQVFKKAASAATGRCFFMYGAMYCVTAPETEKMRVLKWRISGTAGNHKVKTCFQNAANKTVCTQTHAACAKSPAGLWFCKKSCFYRNAQRECRLGFLRPPPTVGCESRHGVKFCQGIPVYDPRLSTGSLRSLCYLKPNLEVVCHLVESPKPSPSAVPVPAHLGRYLSCPDLGCFTGGAGDECVCNTRWKWQVREACTLFGKSRGVRCYVSGRQCVCSLGAPPSGGCNRFNGYSFAKWGFCFVRKDHAVCVDEWRRRHELRERTCFPINDQCSCKVGVQASCALTYGRGCYTKNNRCYCKAKLMFNSDCSKYGSNCLLRTDGSCKCVGKTMNTEVYPSPPAIPARFLAV